MSVSDELLSRLREFLTAAEKETIRHQLVVLIKDLHAEIEDLYAEITELKNLTYSIY